MILHSAVVSTQSVQPLDSPGGFSQSSIGAVFPMASALNISDLNKQFGNGVQALKNIDLTIDEGEFFSILGPNGAGKSTLINIAAQVVSKSSGSVTVFDHCIDQYPQQAKLLLGYTPQEVALDSFFTVREILINHSGYYGIADNRVWIDHLLEKLHLTPFANRNSKTLSGGMKRRLTIAKALVHQPKVLILDEPTAGVDVSLRHSLWEFIRELHLGGTTIILTTHYIEEAQMLADRVAIMGDGSVIACDHTQQLLKSFGTRRFEIQLTDDQLTLPAVLGSIQRRNDQLWVEGAFKTDSAREIFAWLSHNSAQVIDVRIEPASLEDVFLKLTAKS
ncbi:MAG: ABC transporter ATP-binding protein [Magnetococcales bacterium]|nr:ABC transporter ATP-binding protein [Magnetococcales bacterium]